MEIGTTVHIRDSIHIISRLWHHTGKVIDNKWGESRIELDKPVTTPISIIKTIWIKDKYLGY